MNNFDLVKGADSRVLQDIANWENKIDDYVSEFFNDEVERVYGTRFGDNIAIISDIAENATAEPETFRGVRDSQGRLQAAGIVHLQSDYLEVDFLATAPWNIFPNQPESLKGAGTALMEELVKESLDLGKSGRLKLYAIPRARQFYEKLGLEETAQGDWEFSPSAAFRFLQRQERRRGR